jgi:hypothetical protein
VCEAWRLAAAPVPGVEHGSDRQESRCTRAAVFSGDEGNERNSPCIVLPSTGNKVATPIFARRAGEVRSGAFPPMPAPQSRFRTTHTPATPGSRTTDLARAVAEVARHDAVDARPASQQPAHLPWTVKPSSVRTPIPVITIRGRPRPDAAVLHQPWGERTTDPGSVNRCLFFHLEFLQLTHVAVLRGEVARLRAITRARSRRGSSGSKPLAPASMALSSAIRPKVPAKELGTSISARISRGCSPNRW